MKSHLCHMIKQLKSFQIQKLSMKSNKGKLVAESGNCGDVPHQDPMNVFQDIEIATDHGKKRLSIEQIYQKKSQLEHILLRPDTYIGSVEVLEQVEYININSQNFIYIFSIEAYVDL